MAAPVFISASPENASTQVAVNTPISVVFDDLNPATVVTGAVILVSIQNQAKPETIELQVEENDDDEWVIRIFPAYTLNPNTQYKLVLSTAIRSSGGQALAFEKTIFFQTGTHTVVDGSTFESPWSTTGSPYLVTESTSSSGTTQALVSSKPVNDSFNNQLRSGMGSTPVGNINMTFNFMLDEEEIEVNDFSVSVVPIDGDSVRPHDTPVIESVTLTNGGKTAVLVFETVEKTYHVTNMDCSKEEITTSGGVWDENTRVTITLKAGAPTIDEDEVTGETDEDISMTFGTAYYPFWAYMDNVKYDVKMFLTKLGYTDAELAYTIFMESDYLMRVLNGYGRGTDRLFQCPTMYMKSWVRCAVFRRMMEEALITEQLTGGRPQEKQLADFRVSFQMAPTSGPIADILGGFRRRNEDCLRGSWIGIFGDDAVALAGAVQGARAYHPSRLYSITAFTRWRSSFGELQSPDYNPPD